jgi:hypothetical protein
MHKLSLPLASILLLASACDSASAEADAQRSAERSDAELSERASMAVGMFCLKLDCSEQQRAELTAIAQSALPDQEERDRHERAVKTFAETFRADDLDTEVLVALCDQRVTDRAHLRDSLVAAHQVLDTDQRNELADMVESGFGPRMRGGRNAEPGAMAERVATRLCDVAKCDEGQEAAIVIAIADGAPKASMDEMAAMMGRVASVLRTDDLDAKTLERFAAEMEAKRDAMRPRALETLSEVHAMLSPDQRDKVATTLEREGPRGLMGPGLMHP